MRVFGGACSPAGAINSILSSSSSAPFSASNRPREAGRSSSRPAIIYSGLSSGSYITHTPPPPPASLLALHNGLALKRPSGALGELIPATTETNRHCLTLSPALSCWQRCRRLQTRAMRAQIHPTSGPLEGGTLLTIEGSNLGSNEREIQDKITVGGEPCQLVMYSVSTR